MHCVDVLHGLWVNRHLVWRLARAEFKDRYAGTFLGAAWAVLQPTAIMGVFFYVFAFGLRPSGPNADVFAASLLVGLGCWFWFSDAVSGGATAVTQSAYIVKKISFPLEILPVVPTISSLVVHLGVMTILAAGLAVTGHLALPRIVWLVYYMGALGALSISISFVLAAITPFQKDVVPTTGLVINLLFWLTPIVWSFDLFHGGAADWLIWNPMTYVVEGYRYALIAEVTQAPTLAQASAFWATALMIFLLGASLYHRLRADFADVL